MKKAAETLRAALKAIFLRRKKEDQWAARFTNPPAKRDGTLPLDPGKSELS